MGHTFIHFQDKCVTYATFLSDLSASIVRLLAECHDDKDFISQRQAFALFGRANVERWRRQGRVTPMQRPGKLEYKTAELRLLQNTEREER